MTPTLTDKEGDMTTHAQDTDTHVSERYTYRVFWSEEDQEYVATVSEMPLLSHLDPDQVEALKGIKELVRDVIDSGEYDVPEPIGTRTFSGKMMFRTDPAIHRELFLVSNETNVSINELIQIFVKKGLRDRTSGMKN